MKKIFIYFLIIAIILVSINKKIFAEDNLPLGFGEWTTEYKEDKHRIEMIQYGRKVPLKWSDYSSQIPNNPYYKIGDVKIDYYAHDGKEYTWPNADAKTLFIWDFKEKTKLVYFYADVDTCVDSNYSNYTAPPLQLYCDDKLIASVGFHHYLKNWEPDIDCDCSILKLDMSYGGGEGRNRTYIVSTKATTQTDQYAYVENWSDGQDWRFEKEYPHLYGEESQIPVQRMVYSYPVKYRIDYDADGGEIIGEIISEYTIFDEVLLPMATKRGYEFLAWTNQNGIISKIDVGSVGDLKLFAQYERKKPDIFVANKSFDEEDRYIYLSELLEYVEASAIDELDGSISDKIAIEYIKYEDNISYNPDYLDISKKQVVEISFYVFNSGGKKASIKKKYYILGKGETIDNLRYIKIYSRFLKEEYNDSIDDRSIWKTEDYQNTLKKAYQKYKGE